MSLSLWVVVPVAVAVVALGVLIALFVPGRKTDIDAFSQARLLTNRWAQNPDSAPPSIREMARRSRAGEDLVVPDKGSARQPRTSG
ncbi:MAG: hypothetical protein ACJ74O_11820 [Frankiaceae bacterium]